MKWVVAALLIVSLLVSAKDRCSVREFYGFAYGIHDPTERHNKMSDWLTKHEGLCKSSDMVVIWNNLSEWAGSADSHMLRALVIHNYKEALTREKQ